MKNRNEESYHMLPGANRQLYRQNSQNFQTRNDTTTSHAEQITSTSTSKAFDPVNHIAFAIEKQANKNCSQSLFHPKNTPRINKNTRQT